jgi:hypothetical protein
LQSAVCGGQAHRARVDDPEAGIVAIADQQAAIDLPKAERLNDGANAVTHAKYDLGMPRVQVLDRRDDPLLPGVEWARVEVRLDGPDGEAVLRYWVPGGLDGGRASDAELRNAAMEFLSNIACTQQELSERCTVHNDPAEVAKVWRSDAYDGS